MTVKREDARDALENRSVERREGDATVLTCSICHFETELDDVEVRQGLAQCICLRCFARETGSGRPMPKAPRRQVIAALAEIAVT
jgi:hypothetical protein